MNPYEPPQDRPTRKRPRVEIDWMDFFIVVVVVLIGTPLLYSFMIDNISAWLNWFYY